MKKHYSNITVKELSNSEVEVLGEISAEFLEENFKTSLKKISKNLELPGFRKGHVPESMALEKYAEMNILQDAAEECLEAEYAKIIEEKEIRVIGQPQVTLRKLARNNPLEFSMTIAVVPEIKLPNYKKLAKENSIQDTPEVTDKEVDDVILEIRKQHAHSEMHKSGELKDENHAPLEEKDLPELTEDIITSLGNFADLSDLKNKIKENLLLDKQKKSKEKKRLAILDAIIDATPIEVPEILIDSELDKMMAQFEDDVARAGIPFDDYMKNIGKGRPEMKGEWRETAIKKAKVQLILSKIADEEKITPDGDDIRNEAEKILMVHRDADPLRVRVYVGMMMTNEKVLEFLESQG